MDFRVDNLKKTRGLLWVNDSQCLHTAFIIASLVWRSGPYYYENTYYQWNDRLFCHFVETLYDKACNAAYEKPHTSIFRMHDEIQFCISFLSRKILQQWNWKHFYSGAIKDEAFRLFLFCSYKMMKLLTCNCNKISGLATADLVFFCWLIRVQA